VRKPAYPHGYAGFISSWLVLAAEMAHAWKPPTHAQLRNLEKALCGPAKQSGGHHSKP
jgi:hypothetical protein